MATSLVSLLTTPKLLILVGAIGAFLFPPREGWLVIIALGAAGDGIKFVLEDFTSITGAPADE
jgi:hypothetical protein